MDKIALWVGAIDHLTDLDLSVVHANRRIKEFDFTNFVLNVGVERVLMQPWSCGQLADARCNLRDSAGVRRTNDRNGEDGGLPHNFQLLQTILRAIALYTMQ